MQSLKVALVRTSYIWNNAKIKNSSFLYFNCLNPKARQPRILSQDKFCPTSQVEPPEFLIQAPSPRTHHKEHEPITGNVSKNFEMNLELAILLQTGQRYRSISNSSSHFAFFFLRLNLSWSWCCAMKLIYTGLNIEQLLNFSLLHNDYVIWINNVPRMQSREESLQQKNHFWSQMFSRYFVNQNGLGWAHSSRSETPATI